MNRRMRFPIRLKIMISLLLCITAVVSVITFTMARFFHADKQSYMNDWTSVAALSTAEETRSLLEGYVERLQLLALVLLERAGHPGERAALIEEFFGSFPALIEVALYREGKLVDRVEDPAVLDAAGLTADAYETPRLAHVLSLSAMPEGEVVIRNSTLSPELPTFTLALRRAVAGEETPVVIAAELSLDELQRLGARFRVFEIVIADSDGVLLAHPLPARVARRELARLDAASAEVHGRHNAGMTLELTRDGVEVIGGFAGVGLGGVTAAAHIPKSAAYLASRELLGRMLIVGLVLLLVMAVAGRFWARRITRPVERLSGAARTIAKGRFDIHVEVESRDEIGELAASFNQMAAELDDREVALHAAQAQLVQSEKLAAFGQLGAGIAHEVKNPLAGILGCAQLSLMEIEEGTPLHENVRIIEKETERCKRIIDNLLKFARQEKALLEPTDVNTVVHDSAAIVRHQLELNGVKLVQQLDAELPPIHGNSNQLQQVLMNLMINAQQAFEGQSGTVTVTTEQVDAERIRIRVKDDGPGIPPEIQSRLFDPFFTTKPTGQGTGLGLSVSFGIVRDHGGRIEVDSSPGEGAEFILTLPLLADATKAPRVGAGS